MPQHVVVIHRWRDLYADYASYVDHSAHDVTYVTTARAAASLPSGAAAVRTVASTEDRAQVRAAVADLVTAFGPPAHVVALHEVDLDVAAELRAELGVPGDSLDDLAPFRDKLVMADRLAAAGLPVPPTAPAPDRGAVARFAAAHGWPLLLKPVRGTASAGVTRLDRMSDLDDDAFVPDAPVLVQPYVADEVLHVDGVATGVGLGAWRASRYLRTCLDFTAGAPLGSVEIDDPVVVRAVEELTTRVVTALSDRPWVFHLELFLADGADGPRLQVLEVGARPGGAEVPFVWREVHGIDLMEVAFRLQTGRPLPDACLRPVGPEIGGWLLVPVPVARPCRVLAAELRAGDDAPAPPYVRRLPDVGQVLEDLPGYENAGARFRYRGAGSAQVRDAVERTVRELDFRCTPLTASAPARVILVGSGGQAYREYAVADAAARADVVLVAPTEPTWQTPYLVDHRTAPVDDGHALARAVADAAHAAGGRVGVLTWDEVLLEATADVAAGLALPHMSPAAARACRDKLTTRRLLATAGLPAVRFAHVHGLDEALAAAETVGYPVVVKPRSLAGSAGVVVAHDPEELRAVHPHAVDAVFPGIEPLAGVLLEELLVGPEVSVDSVVVDGTARVVNVARKRLGFPPFFEEVGHLVSPWRHEPWARALEDLVVGAHRALGVDLGVTHAEVRLTPDGPRLVELNGRIGGDLIPYLGRLATGIDLTAAAVDLALGVEPDLRPQRDDCAEVRFLYPDEDCDVLAVDVSAAASVPGVVDAVALAAPGTRLLLPPRGVVPRLAAVVATGRTPEECTRVCDLAASRVRARTEPVAVAVAS